MRIGLNLLFMIPRHVGGTETYARGLLSGLQRVQSDHEFVLFLNRESANWMEGSHPKFETVVCPVQAVSRAKRFLYEHLLLRRELDRHRIDLLHSLGYTSPIVAGRPTVVTVPDLNFLAFGHMMPWARRAMLSLTVKRSVLKTDRVITISEFSKREILEAYNISDQHVAVTSLAVDLAKLEFADDQSSLTPPGMAWMNEPYMVAFSATYPNKNMPRLIQAYRESRRLSGIPHRLVLIGHAFEMERKRAEELAEKRDIIWTGYLDQRLLLKVLKTADFLVFPSFYEGFGLPVLEAMALDLPVVCSTAASLPEVAGDAAEYFNPFSVEDMAEKITRVATDQLLRQELKRKGRENVKRFSWERTARETLYVYDELLHNVNAH